MATISLRATPETAINLFEGVTDRGEPVAAIEFDSASIYLGGWSGSKDASIVATIDLLTAELAKLRASAAARVAEALAGYHDEAEWAQADGQAVVDEERELGAFDAAVTA